MPIPKINSAVSPVEKIVKLKENIAVAALSGNFKDFKNNCKELATEAVNNFEACKQASFMTPVRVSTESLSVIEKLKLLKNFVKIKLLNSLRIKTADEKLFDKMCKEEEIRRKLFNA